MNRAQHAGALDCKAMKENITRQSEAANVHGDVHSPPRSLPSGLDLLDFHSKSSPIDQAKINFLRTLDNFLRKEYIMLHRGYNLTSHDTNIQIL